MAAGPYTARTSFAQDGRAGTLLALLAGIALFGIGTAIGEIWLLGAGGCFSFVGVLGTASLVWRLVTGRPSLELLDAPVAGEPVGLLAQLPGDARYVVKADVQITLRGAGTTRSATQRVPVLRTEGRSIELVAVLPELPDDGAYTWDVRVLPVIRVPIVDQEAPSEQHQIEVDGLPLA